MTKKILFAARHPAAATASGRQSRQPACPPPGGRGSLRRASNVWLATLLAGVAAITWQPTPCRAQDAADAATTDADAQDAQVLTRGPVHEAFAGVVTFNPEPGVVAPKAPPEAIEELPPAERPEGNNVTWIPGYWAWDDERNDFLWVSGIWRALPPGRQWMAGYWGQTADGYQWTSGYWADAAARETTYLPAPPATVENGPNIAAPSIDSGWTPGCWIWRQQHYAWRPGYWAPGRADWAWMPAHYVWSPRGYVFVDGYWDYSVARRGVVFAPVYFNAGVYSRPGYHYSPLVAINLALFTEQLFLRPSYHHYYFGDYYAPSYHQGGFIAAVSYQTNRSGYDPIFAHQRWEHRQDREWVKDVEQTYQFRRDHENARPPRTWAALKTLETAPADTKFNHAAMATPIDQLSKRKDSALRFQAVPQADRQKLALQGQEVQKSREQRRTLEAKGGVPSAGNPAAAIQPATVKLNKSPIVGKATTQFKKGEMPPALPPTPKTDLKVLPKSNTPERPVGPDKAVPNPDSNKTNVAPRDKLVPSVPRKTDVIPQDKTVPGVPRKTDVVPRKSDVLPQDKTVPGVPRKTDVVPQDKTVPGVPRKTDVIPQDKTVPSVPRKTDAIPRKSDVTPQDKTVPSVPRKTDVVPRKSDVTPQGRTVPPVPPQPVVPRKTDVVPREKVAPPQVPQAPQAPQVPRAPRERVVPPAPVKPDVAPRRSAPEITPPQPGKKDLGKDPKDRSKDPK